MKNARGKHSRQRRKGAPVPGGAPRSPLNVLSAADADPIAAAFKQAVQQYQSGRLTEADSGLHRIVQSRPEHADAWHLLGTIAFQQKQYRLAIEHTERAIALRPGVADSYFTLGNAYRRTGQLGEAIAAYRRLLELQPENVVAYTNLGVFHIEQGQSDEAIRCFRRAVELQPDYAEAHANLGQFYRQQGKPQEAIECFQQVVRLKADDRKANNALASLYLDRGRLNEARTSFERLVESHPRWAEAYFNLGQVYKDQGNVSRALECYRQALVLKPEFAVAHQTLLYYLHSSSEETPQGIYAEHRNWAERHADTLAQSVLPHRNDPAPERRLRIGYVSGDFKTHSVAYFFEPLLAAHNRRDFEIICYANNKKADAVTARLRQLADGWREIHDLTDEQLDKLVRQDNIDILVDLSGHNQGNRLLAFARKPAPIQVTYIGYPDTTGLRTMDYRFTDAWADSEGQTEHFHTEELVRLPHGFLCYQPPEGYPAVSSPPVGKQARITFGSFNNLSKVNWPLIHCWAAMLKAVPDSRLVLKSRSLADAGSREYFLGLLQQHGIDPARVDLIGWIPDKNQHLALYSQVDIALDTFPYHGTTTTCEALWMGVPVITLAGQTHVSRVGVSLLHAVGLEEFIADSPEAYVEKAVALAQDRKRLEALRGSLRNRLQAAPLTNARLITQSVEVAYRQMWRRWCNQEKSRPVSAADAKGKDTHLPPLGIAGQDKKPTIPQMLEPRTKSSLDGAMQVAEAHHRAGRLQEAEICVQELFSEHPGNSAVWQLGGRIAFQQGHYSQAIERLNRAIELEPDHGDSYFTLGNAYRRTGQLREAIAAYRRLLALQPENVVAYTNLGVFHIEQGQSDEAIRCFQRAIELNPDAIDANNNLGLLYVEQKRYASAIQCFQKILRLVPHHLAALRQLTGIYTEQKRLPEAIDCVLQVIKLNPNDAEAHSNLGCLYSQRGDFEEAKSCFQRAIMLSPNYAEAHNNFGQLYEEQGKYDEARQCLQHAIELRPDYAVAHYNLGNIYKGQGLLLQATQCYQQALKLNPQFADAINNLGNIYTEQGNSALAIRLYRQALDIRDEYAVINPASNHNLLFGLHYSTEFEQSEIYAEHRKWARRIASSIPEPSEPHENERSPDRRLRIGYVSGDFKAHSVAYFFEPLLAAHNRQDFEIICYANNKKADAVTARLRQRADGWREIVALNDEAVADVVRRDKIDILVDLAGHTRDNRLLVFARKPAPIQVSYLGYPDTTGLEAMDYRLVDAWTDPEGQTEHLHSEQLVRLPHGFLCYQPPPDCPAVSPPPVLQQGQLTFGSFNNLAKVSDETVRLWAAILTAVSDSRLLLKSTALIDVGSREYFLGLLQQHGIDPARVDLIGWIPDKNQHLALYSQVDLALDTFPYHGTTTTCEALWMGVPVITLAGQTHVSRVGVSLLHAVGLEEFIADSPEAYVEKAVALAQDRKRLEALRGSLRNRLQAAPLTNARLITQSVEDAYRQLWRRWCRERESAVAVAEVEEKRTEVPRIRAEQEGQGPRPASPLLSSAQQAIRLAKAHHQAGRLQEAEQLYHQVLKGDPDHADALHFLGLLAQQAGKRLEAVALMEKAIQSDGTKPLYYNNLAHVLWEQGQLDNAIDCFQKAVALLPDQIDVLWDLALAYQERGDTAKAIETYSKLIRLKPDLLDAHINLGNGFQDLDDLERATQCYQQALQIRPDHPGALYNLGNTLTKSGRLSEATQHYYRALELTPDDPEIFNNLGNALTSAGKVHEAIRQFQKALELGPKNNRAYSNLVFNLHYIGDCTPATIYAEHHKWAQRITSVIRGAEPPANDQNPDRRLRIGYVSGDFKAHSVAYFVEPLLGAHDREHFEIICYANNKKADAVTARLRELADGWREIVALNDEAVADVVRRDKIDILVDLAGHTRDNRLLVFAHKPAPIQVSYLGYPDTTGLGTMDYRLVDAWTDPEGQTEHLHSEQLIRLPHGFLCYQPPPDSPAVSPPPVLQQGQLTFGSFNNLAKVSDETVRLWAAILIAVPDSRLLLKSKALADAGTREYLVERFKKHGIDPQRLELVGWQSATSQHLALYSQVDIALDTFPYHGTTTTCEALWMGVPVITLAGQTHVSRVGVSLLHAVGLEEFIADSPEAYVEKAVALARDQTRLEALRGSLRNRLQAAPLTNARLMTLSVEDAYRQMWRRWCNQEKSRPVSAADAKGKDTHLPPLGIASQDTKPTIPRMLEPRTKSSVDGAIQLAAAHHRAGRLQEAEVCLQELLHKHPGSPAAWWFWGRIGFQQGHYSQAIERLNRAIELEPDHAESYFTLGNAYRRTGQLHEAIAAYRRLLALQPENVVAYTNLGVFHIEQGQSDEAIRCFQRAIALKPDYAEAHANLGQFYRQQGKTQEAIGCFRQVLGLTPNHLGALFQLGCICKEQEQLPEAILCFRRLIQLRPADAKARNNLGYLYREQGDLDKSKECFAQAIAVDPKYAEAYNNLGYVCRDQGQYHDALQYLKKAIELEPDYAEAYYNLGNVHKDQDNSSQAIQYYQKALALQPSHVKALNNLGSTYKDRGNLSEAIQWYQRAITINPDSPASMNLLFSLHYESRHQPAEIYSEHRKWSERTTSSLVGRLIQRHENERSPDRRLRIGYVSGDFKAHSVAYFVEPLLGAHDRQQFEIICYANNKKADAVTARLRELADGWREIVALNDEEVAALVRQDKIDILVDLAGHTRGNRLLVFARKPAPIQVSYLGYPDTTGLDTMDYRLVDAWTDPEGQTEHLHTEQLVRLPHGFLCYQPPPDCPAVSPPPVLQQGQLTFGSFNNLAKVSDETVRLWAAILTTVPDSRLLLKSKALADAGTREYLSERFNKHGIDAQRLELVGWQPATSQHLALYSQVDLALDTFPYHGTTTTCEALWMGVPVITLAGQTHVSRVGVSLLHGVGLDEFIADSPEAYVEKAVALARDQTRLEALRGSLRNRLQAAPLTNARLMTQSVEAAYRQLWRRWCTGQSANFPSQEQRATEGQAGAEGGGSATRTLAGRSTLHDRPALLPPESPGQSCLPSGAQEQNGGLKLHIGGKEAKEGWKILNIQPGPNVDFVGDCQDLSRFPEGSVSEIYASHVLEHLGYQKDLGHALAEFYRILVPGGRLRISVPDLETLCRLFLHPSLDEQARFRIMRMMFGGQVDSYDFHKVGCWHVRLVSYLQRAGFSSIERVAEHGLFRDASSLRVGNVLISLNLVAVKTI